MRSINFIHETVMPGGDTLEQRLAAAKAPAYLGTVPHDRNIRKQLEAHGWSGPYVLGVGGKCGKFWRRYLRVLEVSA